jgi:hypothetical protein
MGIGITPDTNYTLTVNGAVKIGSLDVTGAITGASVQLTGGSGTQGTLSWNADEETVDIIQNGATLQVGQETHVHVKNQTGSTIADGTPVYVTGTLGASGRLTVAPMIADGSIEAKYFIGITTEDIPNGGDGKVTVFGKIRGLNTSAYSEGQTLYVSASTAGEFQTTAPVAPNLDLEVAIVINSHVNNGTIFVRAQNGHYLGILHDVYLNSPANNQFLVYNSTNSRWENQSISSVGSINLDTVTDNGNTTDNDITVGDITAGNMTLSGYLRGAANFVIDPAAHGDETGVVQILGDLRVDGETTTINSTTVTIDDKNLVLASGSATAADANGAGITIDGADATMTYNSTSDRFVFNKNIETNLVGNVTGDLTGNADTATTWQTARTITIGDTGKTVNGSADVSWTRTEIGITKANIDALNINADQVAGLDATDFTLDYVTDNGSSTTNSITAGGGTFTSGLGVSGGVTIENADGSNVGHIQLGTVDNDAGNNYVRGNILFGRDVDQVTWDSVNDEWTYLAGGSSDFSLMLHDSSAFRILTGDGISTTTTYTNQEFRNAFQALTINQSGDVNIFRGDLKIGSNTVIDSSRNIFIPDDSNINVGTGDDLKLYHNGLHSFIDNATNALYIRNVGTDAGDDIIFIANDTNSSVRGYIRINTTDGAVQISHHDGLRLATTATGIDVTGEIEATGDVTANAYYGDGSNLTGVLTSLNFSGIDGITLTDLNSTIDSYFHANVNHDFGLYAVNSNARYGADYIQIDGRDDRTIRTFAISPKDIGEETNPPRLYLGGDVSATAPNTLTDWDKIYFNANEVIWNGNKIATQSWVSSNIDLQDVTDNGATTTNSITVGGLISTSDLDLPSGGMLDWANGDARIVEGLVNDYSLSFQTYDGSTVSTALRLDGDNTATFGGSVTATSFSGDGKLLDNVFYKSVYESGTTNGFLIETDIATSDYAMMHGTIMLEQFNSNTKQTIEFSATTINTGVVQSVKGTADINVTIKIFNYNNKIYLHVPAPSTFTTCTAYVGLANSYQGQARNHNEIANITVASVPSTGVTNSTNIDCKFSQGDIVLDGGITIDGTIALPQNPVGTTYGNGVSTVPTYMFQQAAGDNDGIRMYAEAGVTNDVRYIFEVIDDIEDGDTWVFRNKKTYTDYIANEVVKISGAGDITAKSARLSNRLYIDSTQPIIELKDTDSTGAAISSYISYNSFNCTCSNQ